MVANSNSDKTRDLAASLCGATRECCVVRLCGAFDMLEQKTYAVCTKAQVFLGKFFVVLTPCSRLILSLSLQSVANVLAADLHYSVVSEFVGEVCIQCLQNVVSLNFRCQ